MEKLINISGGPAAYVLGALLTDKSTKTKKKIIWATDTYEEFGEEFTDRTPMNANSLLAHAEVIRPRIEKSQEAQAERTRKKAEVFTPAWLCNRMNNALDEDWFGRGNVFNTENEDHTWTPTEGKIEFPKRKKWQRYVDSRRLEITCGEAPYLVSRYDVSTGEPIFPLRRRVGILDRKLRIVDENTETREDWLKWTFRAFEAAYGYEYQGDSVLIARINLLLTFVDYYEERWGRQPDKKLLRRLANKIVWNVWQMDGLKDTVPLGKLREEFQQITLFDLLGVPDELERSPDAVPCRIYNWRGKSSLRFADLKEMQTMGKKLFDYVIGNPPYQDESVGEQKSFAAPIYDKFLDSAYDVAERVEMIHPARFLFNAGGTQKAWNKKMLDDPHLKVLWYEAKSDKVFPNTDIKGGIAITYHDQRQNFGAIGVFTAFAELNSIKQKVWSNATKDISDIVSNRGQYRFSDLAYQEQPEEMKKVTDPRISAPVFERMPALFTQEKPNDGKEYVQIYGNAGINRLYRWLRKDYLKPIDALYKYKVMVPAANGSGALGEVISTPLIGEPLIGATETFLSIGSFDTFKEAEHCLKYVRSKFARVMLGILKVTQHNAKPVWRLVPLQDFTANSDIDWSKSVHEIDLQLYRKYGLDEKEIEFIESHVKEMA